MMGMITGILAVSLLLGFTAWRKPALFRENVAYPFLALSIVALSLISAYNIGGLGVNVSDLLEAVSKSEAETAVVKFYAQRVAQRYDFQIKTLLTGGTFYLYLFILIFLSGRGLKNKG